MTAVTTLRENPKITPAFHVPTMPVCKKHRRHARARGAISKEAMLEAPCVSSLRDMLLQALTSKSAGQTAVDAIKNPSFSIDDALLVIELYALNKGRIAGFDRLETMLQGLVSWITTVTHPAIRERFFHLALRRHRARLPTWMDVRRMTA